MLNKFQCIIFGLFMCLMTTSFALSGQAYLDRFNAFTYWYQNIPIHPPEAFLEFIKGSTPLSNKLRDKWLYELARTKNWPMYVAYYQPTNDLNLACFNQIAHYNLGHEEQVFKESASIWLTGDSLPRSCTTLFDLLLKSGKFNQQLITQRMALALEKKNVSLAKYLLKQYTIPRLKDAQTLSFIYQNPTLVTTLQPSEFNSYFYLYGLKKLVSQNMNQALKLWQHPNAHRVMSEAHQHAFMAHVALYKAMRNNPDAFLWFNKVKPQYYNDVFTEWHIRYALKTHNWNKVSQLIMRSPKKDEPCWQYWLGRAKEQQGQKEEAHEIYQKLAKNRNYYGFLASVRLHQKPTFDNEHATTDLSLLAPYQPVMSQIQSLYAAKKIPEASRLLTDFASELPKDEASALVYWVDSRLQWHGKSVYLSNQDLLNNQLALRFPLAYHSTVSTYSKQYNMPLEFVYAIIRQESAFREDVVSHAGAKGLMQLMPSTASLISKASHIPYNNQNELFLSQKNINIGIAYLKQLSKRFSNHPILIAAAYNAGPRQVVNWLHNQPSKEMDLWIETIPWQETRNYLKNVMAFSIVYQYRLNQKPNINPFLISP